MSRRQKRQFKSPNYCTPLEGSSFSNNGGQWTLASSQANKRSAERKHYREAGTQAPVAKLDEETIRNFIDSQICPWCGGGPYKVLAMHTSNRHGVSGDELRYMAGLPKSASICSPEVSEQSRESLVNRADWKAMREKGARRAGTSRSSHPDVMARRIEKFREAISTRYERENLERDSEVIALVESGRPRDEVAEIVGIHSRTVRLILERHGIHVDGRTSRGARRRGKPMHPNVSEGAAARRSKERAEIIAKYENSSKSPDDILMLAQEYGSSQKSMVARLKKYGLSVPDLRGKTKASIEASAARRGRKPCIKDSCDRKSVARGMCDMHYRREIRRK